MTQAQATALAQSGWDQMPYDQKMAYERKAQQYGDPIARQERIDTENRMAPKTFINVTPTINR